MAIVMAGAGVSVFSVGQTLIAITPAFLYRAFSFATGGTAIQTAGAFDFANDLPSGSPGRVGDEILGGFGGRKVSLEIPDLFIGQGIVKVTFTIFDDGGGTPVYQFTRRPTLRGVISSTVSINTNQFTLLDLNEDQNQSMFDNMIAGNFIIHSPGD
jgi:hypothetical protein